MTLCQQVAEEASTMDGEVCKTYHYITDGGVPWQQPYIEVKIDNILILFLNKDSIS